MGTNAKGPARRNRAVLSAGWAAGIGITLVEMHFGMDYVLSHIAAQIGFVVNWLPTIRVLTLHIWR